MTKLTDQLADSARHQIAAEQRARGPAPNPAEIDLGDKAHYRRDYHPQQSVEQVRNAQVIRHPDAYLGEEPAPGTLVPAHTATAQESPPPGTVVHSQEPPAVASPLAGQ